MILQTYFTALKLSRYERKNIHSVRKRTLNFQAGIVNIFQLSCPPSFRGKAELGTRERPSSSENMPFNVQEGRLLHARKACSQTLFVTY